MTSEMGVNVIHEVLELQLGLIVGYLQVAMDSAGPLQSSALGFAYFRIGLCLEVAWSSPAMVTALPKLLPSWTTHCLRRANICS